MNNNAYKDLYYCDNCKKLFKYPAKIKNYERYEQDDPESYEICPNCGSNNIKDYDSDFDELDAEQVVMKLSDLWISIERGNQKDIESYKAIYLAILDRVTNMIDPDESGLI